jgi:hypothetical protein
LLLSPALGGQIAAHLFSKLVSEHPHLENQVDLLIDNGFVDNVTVTNAPMFKMREQFVQLLREHP